jgi:hypothetical protein
MKPPSTRPQSPNNETLAIGASLVISASSIGYSTMYPLKRSTDQNRARLYIFGWPGSVGGASTKLAHLLRLLHGHFPIVVVPNEKEELQDAEWTPRLRALGITACAFEDLPERLEGWGLSLCNFDFLMSARWPELRARGLKMAWSNEMMWTHPGELGAIFTGALDQVLYVSQVQREALEPEFRRVWTGSLKVTPPVNENRACSGEIEGTPGGRRLRWSITGNYIDPALFPSKELRLKPADQPLVIGRLSRADPGKFPEDFPTFYEGLGVRRATFRVMGWSVDLARRWEGHAFDARWELLPPMKEDPSTFLRSLDIFVYSLGTGLRESWGRSVVEAMLSGVVPVLPDSGEHHLRNLVKHGESGFLCRTPEEFGTYARMLDSDRQLLLRCARRAREDALERHCAAEEHLRAWKNAFPDLVNLDGAAA